MKVNQPASQEDTQDLTPTSTPVDWRQPTDPRAYVVVETNGTVRSTTVFDTMEAVRSTLDWLTSEQWAALLTGNRVTVRNSADGWHFQLAVTGQPAQPIEHKVPLATALEALAVDIDNGAPAFYGLSVSPGVIEIQLPASEASEAQAELTAWGHCLGVTSVRVEHDWGTHGDKYTVEGLLCPGWRLHAWNAWRRPESPKPTSHVPLASLERGFDEPPTWPPTPAPSALPSTASTIEHQCRATRTHGPHTWYGTPGLVAMPGEPADHYRCSGIE